MITKQSKLSIAFSFGLLLSCGWTSTASAAWFDSAWAYRRSVTLPAEKPDAPVDLCMVEFYTAGHALPGAQDVRVATEDGKLVASHLLQAGPGDRVRVVFLPQKSKRDYFIYFGNPKPEEAPKNLTDVPYKGGLMCETRQWSGGQANTFETIEKAFDRSKPVLGQTIIDQPFIGFNPLGDQEQWISKMVGTLNVPAEGDYLLAMAADDEGSMSVDGKPTLFAHLGGADIRYHTTMHLAKGPHDVLFYHVNHAGPGFISVGWKKPDAPKVEIIGKSYFGICVAENAGPLEEHSKTLTADFNLTQQGECFFIDDYSFRYHFAAKIKSGLSAKYEWDLGDGQTSTSAEFDHVYLSDGVYTVKLTARAGGNTDTQTTKISVSRNFAHVMDAHEDSSATQSKIVGEYDLTRTSEASLPRTVQLHLKADRLDAALAAGEKLAAAATHADPANTFIALKDLEQRLIDGNRADAAIGLYDRVPLDSSLQPAAARRGAELAMWWTGDFDKAVKMLKPFHAKFDDDMKRMNAQAMALSGKVEEANAIFNQMATHETAARKAAKSGAFARTVEFYLTEKDAEAGETAWEKWMAAFPTEFTEGYSVVLRAKLIQLRGRPQAAARLAEAFAIAFPKSSYAPQLLDRASKLLATSDAAKSQQLHQMLKEKYPEDPLSQN